MQTSSNKYVQRLYQEWKLHNKIIIAVDYDDTISPWKFKSKEDIERFDRIIQLLRIAHETGAYIVIFTACNEDRYDEIKKYCDNVKLSIDDINRNPLQLPYGNSSKIYANIYLDDRAGLEESLQILESAMYMVRGDRASNLILGEHV